MRFKEVENKEKYLKENYIYMDIPKLTDKKKCRHCDTVFQVSAFKVIVEYNSQTKQDEEFIVCPKAPKCDGTLIDWRDADF